MSVKAYVAVFVALLMLLGATVGIAYFDLGAWNVAIALGIALLKMWLVVLFFMHVRHSSRLVWVYAGVGFFWLCILMALTFSDYLTRR